MTRELGLVLGLRLFMKWEWLMEMIRLLLRRAEWGRIKLCFWNINLLLWSRLRGLLGFLSMFRIILTPSICPSWEGMMPRLLIFRKFLRRIWDMLKNLLLLLCSLLWLLCSIFWCLILTLLDTKKLELPLSNTETVEEIFSRFNIKKTNLFSGTPLKN